MRYVLWAVFAMVSYSFVFLFGKLAMEELPAFALMTIAVSFVMVASVLVTAATGDWQLTSVTDTHALFAYAAGLTLTGAVVGYFRALSTGPASVVFRYTGCSSPGARCSGYWSSTNRLRRGSSSVSVSPPSPSFSSVPDGGDARCGARNGRKKRGTDGCRGLVLSDVIP